MFFSLVASFFFTDLFYSHETGRILVILGLIAENKVIDT